MSEDRVSYSLDGGIALVRMDDGKVNAIQAELLRGLNLALDRAEEDRAGAVVLAGREGRFSAGLDLKVLPGLSSTELMKTLQIFNETMLRLFLFPRPIVAAITGHAIAGGAVMALGADVRVMAEGLYKIGLNETQIAITLPAYVVDMAACELPANQLTDAVLHGRLYSPHEAAEVGWVDGLAGSPESCIEAALERARSLATIPARAYVETKRLLRGRAVSDGRGRAEEELEAFRAAIAGAGS